MTDSGRDLNAAKYRADLALDRLFADVGPALAASVRRHAVTTAGGLQITEAARRAILADTEDLLAPLYGRRRGDPGQVGRLVARSAVRMYGDVLRGTAGEIRARLRDEPELIERLGGDGPSGAA